MKHLFVFLILGLISITLINCSKEQSKTNASKSKELSFAIVIHGGAGTIKKEFISPEKEKKITKKLQEALNAGYGILNSGGSSLDAVQAAINVMENSPLFNAGKGAVFNSKGKNEMDASIMDGKTLNAGAVAGVQNIKNPINVARLVMDSIHHVLLSGKGAESFAKKYGIQFEDDAYFYTERRWNSLMKIKEKNGEKLLIKSTKELSTNYVDEHKYGTVGAVAMDKNGNIAAATSTGGMTNKKFNRIGDSPIIGAGTYANNATCGISSTGTGEYFIRTLAAHETSNLVLYKNLSLKNALHEVIFNQIAPLGGDGGMIGLDKNGDVAWDFNTEGMYRGYKKSTGENVVKLYKE
ncbi:MAG: isoaspartyl peptidase/L-asparaginase [Flavobacteriaceae bacterium]|nr:isoaspartyl peptidase/L-asparaginase [Flavobacteriaceae bacterium]